MIDRQGRQITYVRVSVTDRCNLRCQYCMPESGVQFLPHEEILRFEEMIQVVHALAQLGVRRVKLTGGEPLCRKDLPELVRMLYQIDGIEQVTLTTNAILLPEQAQRLAQAGIMHVNISLDTLRPERYAVMTRCGTLAQALKGIDAAKQAGMYVKLNTVAIQGMNEDEIPDLVRFGRREKIPVRFIELMPIGLGASRTGLSNAQVLERIAQEMPHFKRVDNPTLGNGPAVWYEWEDGGIFGLIGAVHNQFCETCNRVRLTADGMLRLCLARPDGIDLKPYLRGGKSGLQEVLAQAVENKPACHTFAQSDTVDRAMNGIGG